MVRYILLVFDLVEVKIDYLLSVAHSFLHFFLRFRAKGFLEASIRRKACETKCLKEFINLISLRNGNFLMRKYFDNFIYTFVCLNCYQDNIIFYS